MLCESFEVKVNVFLYILSVLVTHSFVNENADMIYSLQVRRFIGRII